MRKFSAILGIFAVAVFSLTGISFADEGAEVSNLKQEVRDLRGEIASMKRQMSNIQNVPATQGGYVSPSGYVPPATEGRNGVLRAAEDIDISGYMDVQYTDQHSQATPNASGNRGRIFDNNRDTFSVNSFEIDIERAANPEGGAGFRADLQYGQDARAIGADGSSSDAIDLQQAYIEYIAPLNFFNDNKILPQSIKFQVGRFVTLAGAEVIESKDNWNISRSFGFGLAIPFVHTGLRSNFKLWEDFFDVYLGVNNGWDNAIDNNTYKTLEAGLGFKPLESVSFFHSVYWGPENADQNGRRRFLLSNVMGWDVTDRLSLKGEFNFGNQSRAALSSVIYDSPTFDTANWYNWAAYARYQFTEKWALANRFEIFRDTDFTRTTTALNRPTRSLWAYTATAEYKLTDNTITRLEYRFDKADDGSAAFENQNSHQSTIGAQVLYLF